MVEKVARKHIKNYHGFLDINDLINAALERLYDAFNRFEGKITDIKSASKGRVYVFSRNDTDDRVDKNHPEGQMEFYGIAYKLKSLLSEKSYSMLIMKNN